MALWKNNKIKNPAECGHQVEDDVTMSASAMDVDLGKDGDSWDDVHHHFRAIVAEALKTSVTGLYTIFSAL